MDRSARSNPRNCQSGVGGYFWITLLAANHPSSGSYCVDSNSIVGTINRTATIPPEYVKVLFTRHRHSPLSKRDHGKMAVG